MPRAKKTDTKTAPKKTPAKKTSSKKKEPTVEQIIAEQVQQQLQEALLNIEIEVPQQNTDAFVDMDLLRDEIKKQVEFETRKNLHVGEATTKSKAELTRSSLNLTGEKEYIFTSDLDGLVLSQSGKAIFTAGKTGAMGFGIKAPRTVGTGSAHFRANYPSEAPIPTSGLGSTRGVIVEGDGDDEKTFAFRTLSRMNRQGVNITSDGSMLINDSEDSTLSRLSVNQTDNDAPCLNILGSSKYYDTNLVNIQSKATQSSVFNLINAKVDVEKNGGAGIDVYRVDGEGSVYSDKVFYSNGKGYAELFEWADGNHKNEYRSGLTVALNSQSKLVIADEGDTVIGVVSDNAAFIGNAGWNALQHRFNLNSDKVPMQSKYKVVEWLDDVGVLHSYFLDALDKDFALPDNAIIYETLENGNDMYRKDYRSDFDIEAEYSKRTERGFACVILTGTTTVFKGQFMNDNWIKLNDVNDDLEEWIIK